MSLTGRVVRPISGRVGFSSAAADPQGRPYDFAIAGQMFQTAASPEMPYRRQTAPFKKDQQDAEQEPGEQSLTGWWLRSQESFHKGSGILYQESRVATDPSERFRDSMGVDVWTPGQVSLLADTVALKTAASTSLLARGIDGTTPVVFQASGTALYRITAAGSAAVTWGGAGTIIDLVIIGGSYYATDNVGIWKGTVAGGNGAKVYDNASPSCSFLGESGGFLLLLAGNKAYDLTGVAGPALPAAFFTHRESTFKWTAACSGPGDVRAAGLLGDQASVWTFKPTISSSGWTYTQATGLPAGETVLSLANYYNTFLAVGTTKGFRLASFGDSGQYTFGPLTYQGGRVTGVATVGRYVYAAAENGLTGGLSGLVRIDPETELESGHFAYANDLSTGAAGTMGQVADLGGRVVFTTTAGSWIGHLTNKVASGYLTTGRVRFRTLEPKLFKYVRVRADALQGTIGVDALLDTETYSPIIVYGTAGSSELEEASLPQVIGAQESMSLRLTLTRAADATRGPVLRSYQLKVLPAPKRQRIFQVPILIYDRERSGRGLLLGKAGEAESRLTALEAAEDANDLVLFQDFRTDRSYLVLIDEITYIENAPPGTQSKTGGKAYVTLRTVA